MSTVQVARVDQDSMEFVQVGDGFVGGVVEVGFEVDFKGEFVSVVNLHMTRGQNGYFQETERGAGKLTLTIASFCISYSKRLS